MVPQKSRAADQTLELASGDTSSKSRIPIGAGSFHTQQGLVNAANSLGMASSGPMIDQPPQQQSLPFPSGLPHMLPAASGTYDDAMPDLPQAGLLQAPDEVGGSSLQPAADDDAAAVGLRVRSQSSADRHHGNRIAISISPVPAASLPNGAVLQVPGLATTVTLGHGSQEAAEASDGGGAENGPSRSLEKQSQLHQPADSAAAAVGNGVGILSDAQPLRRKRTKRVKVEVPRDPIDDGTSDGIPKARNENGHSYRNGSLKVCHHHQGVIHPFINTSLVCTGSASCFSCS